MLIAMTGKGACNPVRFIAPGPSGRIPGAFQKRAPRAPPARVPSVRCALASAAVPVSASRTERAPAAPGSRRDADALDADEVSGHLLGVLAGIRVLARTGARRKTLESVARPALALLEQTR